MTAPKTTAELGTGEGPDSAVTSPLVVGVDLSLTATGIAHLSRRGLVTDTLAEKSRGLIRLRRLAATITALTASANLVCVEGPAYSQGLAAGYHERAGLHWLLLDRLWDTGKPVAVIGPSVLKKFATGKGNASKDAMILAAARRFPTFVGDNNQADALWLAAAGLTHLTSVEIVPAKQRECLMSVDWPTIVRAA